MRRAWRGLKTELVPTLSLAWPVIAAELGWMGMGVVDTIVVGRLGAEAIGIAPSHDLMQSDRRRRVPSDGLPGGSLMI
jgi:hypothetical protein